jgi:CheY-like chemotaxis protein
LFKGKVADYKTLVTDVNLKGALNGWEVAKQIREMASDFPIVYMTAQVRTNGPRTAFPTASCCKSPLHLRSL